MPSMIFTSPPEDLTTLQADIAASYRADETQVVKRLLDAAHFSIEQLDNIAARARALVVEVRKRRIGKGVSTRSCTNMSFQVRKVWCSCVLPKPCFASPMPKPPTV